MAQSRGLRNNNPGNIDRHDGTKWQGMATDQSADARFVVFKSAQYGIRAIARLMLTYQNQHKLNTVRKIINRWAPPVENNTLAYVRAVAANVGVLPDDVIDVDTVEVMLPLVKAIITHENGKNPYSDAVVLEGIKMAGVADAKPKPLRKQNTFVAQATAGAATVAAAAAQVSDPAKKAADQLAAFTGAPIISHTVEILMTIAGLAALAGIVSAYLKHRSE